MLNNEWRLISFYRTPVIMKHTYFFSSAVNHKKFEGHYTTVFDYRTLLLNEVQQRAIIHVLWCILECCEHWCLKCVMRVGCVISHCRSTSLNRLMRVINLSGDIRAPVNQRRERERERMTARGLKSSLHDTFHITDRPLTCTENKHMEDVRK